MVDLSDSKVFFLGASNVSMEAAALAAYMGFQTAVVDEDAGLLNEQRFPSSELILIDLKDSK